MALPTLSVVVPNFNVAEYLPSSLGALIEQSVPPLEIIVVDDGSTDGSVQVVTELARRCPFLRLVRHERNMGLVAALNTGLAQAKGDFVTFPASDDQVLPGFVERSLELLARHPGAGICSALGKVIGLDGRELGPYLVHAPCDTPRYFSPEEMVEQYRKTGSWFVTHTVVYRRSEIEALGGFDPALGPANDGALTFLIGARRGVCFIPEPLACWRRRGQSVAAASSDTVPKALAAFEAQEKRLTRPSVGPGMPDAFLRAWWRRSLIVALSEFSGRPDCTAGELRVLIERIPDRGLGEAAALAALRLPGLGRYAAKLLVVSHEPLSFIAGIAARKLRRLIGAGMGA